MARKFLLLVLLLAPLAFYPWLRDKGRRPIDDDPLVNARPVHILSPNERHACQSLASLPVLPGQAFPALLSWESLRVIGKEKADSLEELAKRDPLAFLEECLQQYHQQVQGYRLNFVKQEKVNGKLRRKETIRCCFREKPFSVHMHWLKGQEEAIRSMYVEGENDGRLVARGIKFGFEVPFLVTRTLDSPDVKGTSRFPITEFGIYKGAESTITAMRAAKERDKLFVRYEGLQQVKELGDRYCYKLVRGPYDPPEADNVGELILYIDAEMLMQTGSVLKDPEGGLIAEYFFRDIELNPTFDAKQFTDKGM